MSGAKDAVAALGQDQPIFSGKITKITMYAGVHEEGKMLLEINTEKRQIQVKLSPEEMLEIGEGIVQKAQEVIWSGKKNI